MPESQKRAAAKENGQNVSYVAGMRIDGHDQPWLVLIERSSSAVSDPENRGGYIAQAVSAAINADLFVKTIMAREASQAHLLSEEVGGTPPGAPAPLGMRSLPTPSLGCAPSFGHG
jgi:ABC-type transport system substrate-binding protein